jgi:hypothetical protein
MRPSAWAEGVEQDDRVVRENDGGSHIGPEGSSNSTPSIAAKRAHSFAGILRRGDLADRAARYFPRFFLAMFSRAHASLGLPDLSRDVNSARRSICSRS